MHLVPMRYGFATAIVAVVKPAGTNLRAQKLSVACVDVHANRDNLRQSTVRVTNRSFPDCSRSYHMFQAEVEV